MDGWDDPKVHILQLVHSWLCDTSHGEWTMVVDNADDASVFFSNTSQSCAPGNSNSSVELLSDFLPQSPNGSILITSRTQTVAWKLVGNNSSIFEVKPMDTDHALALLEKKLGSDIPRDEALRLIDALDYMPLALSQAAAFINERAPRMSISKYVDDINKSDQDRARLLTKDVGDSRRDGRASNSVLTTWQISFNYIREHAPTAARLLSLMSMFDRQGIPDSLLINHYADSEFGECDFDDDIHILSSFSLVKMNVDGREFEMHRLVQFSTKKWLAFYDEEETWKAKYAIIMGASFPKGDYENWSVCRALLPHAQAIVDSRPRESQPQEAWAVVIHNLASYLCDMGQYNTSKKLSSVALQSRQSILGEEHTDTLNSLVIFGIILEYQGKYDEAEVVHKRVLGIRERTLGLDHVNTQDSMLNLANTYACQGQLHRAEEMQMQAMELRKINLGEDHPDTLISMGNLASTYLKQRRWKEAENLDVQVLVARKATLGKDHPNTLVSMSNLAMTYSDQGRWQEAENLGVQVLRGRKAKLGKNHPDTLVSMSNLAITYSDQGRWQEAENLEVQVLKARKAKLGEDHPNTLISMGNLAQTYLGQGRWQEAEKLNVQVLEARKTKLGEDHPDTLTCMGNLASTYSSQGRWKEAESLEVQVLRGRKAKLGKDHPDTLMSMSNLACTWWIRGHRDEALELMENCVQLKRRVLGVRHDHTINSMETLDDWREELADPVQTTEEREEIEGAGTTPEKIAKMSAQKPTDPVRTTKTRVVIEEAEQAPEEIAETPAQETVMKKRKSIAVRMRQDHKSGTD
jgi:tetratricopeptide (TPR) repeat protein